MNIKRTLLEPLSFPGLTLNNRVVMAPMSRRRSEKGIPGRSTAIYYGQRAGAGLIIAENTAVTPNGIGYLHTPGIYNDLQKTGWKWVTDEVHAKGGRIFIQLVHAGRIGHPENNEDGAPLVAPSAVKAGGEIRTLHNGHLPIPEPLALSTADTGAMIEAHIKAAENAIEAGFDGVEIHGAHGFLPEQFLHPLSNRRTDRYGGSIANRNRFLLEIMEGVVAAIGKERTGIRLSPFATINDLPAYREEKETHQYLTDALRELDILYIHLSSQPVDGKPSINQEYIKEIRNRFHNLLIVAGGYTRESAEKMLRSGLADLIAFGRPFIANPDLVERFRHNTPLAAGDTSTYYQGGDCGYIDYPAIYDAAQADARP